MNFVYTSLTHVIQELVLIFYVIYISWNFYNLNFDYQDYTNEHIIVNIVVMRC